MKVIKLSAIESTNSYLKEMNSKISVDDETVVWTDSQTRGRGQRGTSWYSEPGKSLAFSLLKRYYGLPADAAVLINLAVSLGVADALDNLKIPDVTVKWPNDIMSANRKVAGILIETQLQGDTISSCVVGIGINVNNEQFKDLPHAGSLFLASKRTFELEFILAKVIDEVFEQLRSIPSNTFESLAGAYELRLFRKGVVSNFRRRDGQEFEGEITGISETGDLVVAFQNGQSENFQLKEIELLY